jgi:hypothetical protein
MFARHRLAPLALLAVLSAACAGAPTPQPGLARIEPPAEAAPAQALAAQPMPGAAGPVVEAVAAVVPQTDPVRPVLAPQPTPQPPSARQPQPAVPPQPASVPHTQLWMESLRPTPLLSGPAPDTTEFTTLPPSSFLKVMERKLDWLLVAYGGDGETRMPGLAWVRAADVAVPSQPPLWAKNHRSTRLWSGSDSAAVSYTDVPQWSLLELKGQERGGRLQVGYPGDGRYRQPGVAWVDAADIGPVQAPRPRDLPRAYPATTRPDVFRLRVPYRSQLDGSPWAEANCGPTTLSMALEALGMARSSAQLREEVLDAQEIWGDDAGVYMDALAIVAGRHGAQVLDLFQNGELRRWSLEDIRRHLREGRPVILQVVYRALPGRQDSEYYGDHYIVITGLMGDGFLYNDAVDSDGVGYDRVMTAAELSRAMRASDTTYAYAGFALAKR